jgi:aminoglycoside phosphotransferase (APT) family kinase protein
MSGSDIVSNFRDIAQSLHELGLLGDGEQFSFAPLSGGVSCDVFQVEVKRRPPVVVKRALGKLRVAADWRAPVERSESEVAWIALASEVDPRLVPKVIAQDDARHLFVMEYLPKERYPVWKDRLLAGEVDVAFAASVGTWLARLHGATARSLSIARRFANQAQFHALRLEPYLLHSAEKHSDVAQQIRALVESVAHAHIALMQGDVSPKNILIGPETPVFLDAETACYGDPAFDLAFCLNHLLLKCVVRPDSAPRYANAFGALKEAYFAEANWEMREHLDARAVRLLGALLLARVDGKSPVEYLTDEGAKRFVRETAKGFIAHSPPDLGALSSTWTQAVAAHFAGTGSRVR